MIKKLKEWIKKVKDKMDKNPESNKNKKHFIFLGLVILFFATNIYIMKDADRLHKKIAQSTNKLVAIDKSVAVYKFENNIGLISKAIQDEKLDKINVVKANAGEIVLMEVYLKDKTILLYDSLDSTGLFSLEKEVIYPNSIPYNVFRSPKQLPFIKQFEAKQETELAKDSDGASAVKQAVVHLSVGQPSNGEQIDQEDSR